MSRWAFRLVRDRDKLTGKRYVEFSLGIYWVYLALGVGTLALVWRYLL